MSRKHAGKMATIAQLPLNIDYKQWLIQLKVKIQQTQIQAALRVNEELLRLYWQMGQSISTQRMDAKWGSGFFVQLSRDLQIAFPDMRGFSVSNLKYIKRFYLFYSELLINRQQLVDEIDEAIFRIPWGHNVILMTKCHTPQDKD